MSASLKEMLERDALLTRFLKKLPKWPIFRRFMAKRRLRRGEISAFYLIIGMQAKLVHVDGQSCVNEVVSFENFIVEQLKLEPDVRLKALEIFRIERTAETTFEDYAYRYLDYVKGNRQLCELAIDALLAVALANNDICKRERDLLYKARDIFGISVESFNQIAAIRMEIERLREEFAEADANINQKKFEQAGSSWGGLLFGDIDLGQEEPSPEQRKFYSEANKYYLILGCKPGDSVEIIKNSYRNLVKQNHPDVLISKGLPPEQLREASDRFKQIQHAYEELEKKLDFN